MKQSRILLPNKDGEWHQIVSVGLVEKAGIPNLYFFFTKNFCELVDSGSISYLSLLKATLPETSLPRKSFSEMHLRYPPDGNIHLQFKDSYGKRIRDITPLYVKHEPLIDLLPAKRIFTIIPKHFEHYPIYHGPESEFDWRVEYPLIPDSFLEHPIRLNFWIGKGPESHLLSKSTAIQKIEMEETLRYVQVFQGQDKDFQLFMSISRPQELINFPSSMRLFLHPKNGAKRLKKGL